MIPVEHHLTLEDNKDVSKPYKYLVHCTCQWEAICHTELVTLRWLQSHAQEQTLRGNYVFIDVPKEKLEELRRGGTVSIG